jgi:hypothetical protein
MGPKGRLIRWKRHLKKLRLNPRQVAEIMKINAATAYNWNSGAQDIPPARLAQLELMK